jgi:glycerol-3-phosphate O-acyltransferase
VYRQGYGSIIYDAQAVKEIAALGQDHPIVFLPSHRSNLDRLSLQYLLWENDLPPNHTAAGINMNFFPVGPLIRRTGAFFIRRSFKDNHLYKYVFRSYLDYLVERRFPLEWYMEGGRSRSGKLLPPKYGLLGWVVESVHRHKADDLYLIPTSITYDQIMDVADYASEARGGTKEKESFGWALKAIRSLRRRYGNIHVRFAEPMSVSKEIPPGDDDEVSIELQKLAFEVMFRIGQVTPITPTAVVAIALLSARGKALDTHAIVARAGEIDAYVEEMDLPTTEPLHLERASEVIRTIDQLAAHGSVSRTRSPAGDVFHLAGEQCLQAAYYRNAVVQFFAPGAIAELAVLAAEPDRPESVFEDVTRLRDLLKFEFFFPEREAFHSQVEAELGLMAGDWRSALEGGPEAVLANAPLLRAHWAVLPFLESYQIVADLLVDHVGDVDRKAFVASCLQLGARYRLEGRVGTDESISGVLFASALDLAANRGLLDSAERPLRLAWAREIADTRARAERVAELAEARLAERS